MSELYHFSFSKTKSTKSTSSKPKSFLYVARVPLKNKTKEKKWRYFYDKKEYEAYLRGRNPNNQPLIGIKKIGKDDTKVGDRKPTLSDSLNKSEKDRKSDRSSGLAINNLINQNKATQKENKMASIQNRKNAKDQIKSAANDLVTGVKNDISNKINNHSKEQYDKKVQKKINTAEVVNKISGIKNDISNKVDSSSLAKDFRDIHAKNEIRKAKFDELLGGKTLTKEQASDYVNHAAVINPRYQAAKNGEMNSWGNYSYTNNCQSCAFTFDLRMRGYNVEAAPAMYDWQTRRTDKENGEYSINSAINKRGLTLIEPVWTYDVSYPKEYATYLNDMYIDPKAKIVVHDDSMIWTKPTKTDGVINTFEDHVLKDGGSGSYGMIMMQWQSGGGHVFNYYVSEKSEIVYIDCQSGETFTDLYNYYQYSDGMIEYCRTDNLSLNRDSAYIYSVKADTPVGLLPDYIEENMQVKPSYYTDENGDLISTYEENSIYEKRKKKGH